MNDIERKIKEIIVQNMLIITKKQEAEVDKIASEIYYGVFKKGKKDGR